MDIVAYEDEHKFDGDGDGSARVFAHFGLRPSPWR